MVINKSEWFLVFQLIVMNEVFKLSPPLTSRTLFKGVVKTIKKVFGSTERWHMWKLVHLLALNLSYLHIFSIISMLYLLSHFVATKTL